MDERDEVIRQALAATGVPAAAAKGVQEKEIAMMIQVAVEENRRKTRRLWWYNVAWHVFFMAALLVGVGYIFSAGEGAEGADMRAVGLFVSMASLSGAVAIKCWFWIVHSRLRLELRLKEMEVVMVEMREMVRGMKS